jgi:hypothetical protein
VLSFLQTSLPEPCIASSSAPCLLISLPISSSLIRLFCMKPKTTFWHENIYNLRTSTVFSTSYGLYQHNDFILLLSSYIKIGSLDIENTFYNKLNTYTAYCKNKISHRGTSRDIMFCSPIKLNRNFGGTYHFHLQNRRVNIIIITHGAETFLRSCQLCSYSRTSQHFMEPRRFITVFTRALHWSLF